MYVNIHIHVYVYVCIEGWGTSALFRMRPSLVESFVKFRRWMPKKWLQDRTSGSKTASGMTLDGPSVDMEMLTREVRWMILKLYDWHSHTVENGPFIKSHLALRNHFFCLSWCKFGHATRNPQNVEATKPAYSTVLLHPGVELRANRKSISYRCHFFEVAFA